MKPNDYHFNKSFALASISLLLGFTSIFVSQDLINKDTRAKCNQKTDKLIIVDGVFYDQWVCVKGPYSTNFLN